jgi:hypothetical protein
MLPLYKANSEPLSWPWMYLNASMKNKPVKRSVRPKTLAKKLSTFMENLWQRVNVRVNFRESHWVYPAKMFRHESNSWRSGSQRVPWEQWTTENSLSTKFSSTRASKLPLVLTARRGGGRISCYEHAGVSALRSWVPHTHWPDEVRLR